MSNSNIVDVQSDTGMLVIYDPAGLQKRVKASSSWWKGDPLALVERKDGRLACWPIGAGRSGTRSHRIRVTSTTLTEAEQALSRGETSPCPLVLESDEVFVGPIERLPCDGAGDRLPELPDGGGVYPCEPGRYKVSLHVLDWQREERFWTEDNEPTADAPADFVLVLEPAAADLVEPPADPKPLLDFIPKKTPLASKTITHATRPRPKMEEEKPKRGRASRKKVAVAKSTTLNQKVSVKARKPGEMGVGAKVRHAIYGVGEVRFMREGFPKVKVSFHDRDYKVDKSELKVES